MSDKESNIINSLKRLEIQFTIYAAEHKKYTIGFNTKTNVLSNNMKVNVEKYGNEDIPKGSVIIRGESKREKNNSNIVELVSIILGNNEMIIKNDNITLYKNKKDSFHRIYVTKIDYNDGVNVSRIYDKRFKCKKKRGKYIWEKDRNYDLENENIIDTNNELLRNAILGVERAIKINAYSMNNYSEDYKTLRMK